mmetsp:Transcript_4738/g.14297  ORF Transcript_4738/g.14297 Transcript_4738/m.14297 type:complete len:220 (-) Transcript_4738:432-1091(-)
MHVADTLFHIRNLPQGISKLGLSEVSRCLLHDRVADIHAPRHPRHNKLVFHLEASHDECIEIFPPLEEELQILNLDQNRTSTNACNNCIHIRELTFDCIVGHGEQVNGMINPKRRQGHGRLINMSRRWQLLLRLGGKFIAVEDHVDEISVSLVGIINHFLSHSLILKFLVHVQRSLLLDLSHPIEDDALIFCDSKVAYLTSINGTSAGHSAGEARKLPS